MALSYPIFIPSTVEPIAVIYEIQRTSWSRPYDTLDYRKSKHIVYDWAFLIAFGCFTSKAEPKSTN